MRAAPRLSLLAFALTASAASTLGPGDDIPEPDRCESAEAGDVEVLELGSGNEEQFEPLEDGDVVQFEYGAQGSAMLPIRYRLQGDDLPACLAQEVELRYCRDFRDCLDELPVNARNDAPLKTYEEPDGSRTTLPLFLIMSGEPAPGDPMELRVTAGGQTETRRLYGGAPPPDAGPPDAGPP